MEGAPPGVLIGKELAQRLGLVVGSRVNLLSPSGQKTTAGFQPRIRPYKVAGIFQTGMFEYDSSLGFISLAAARDLLGLPSDQISGIEVTVKDVYKADTVARRPSKRSSAAGFRPDMDGYERQSLRCVEARKNRACSSCWRWSSSSAPSPSSPRWSCWSWKRRTTSPS